MPFTGDNHEMVAEVPVATIKTRVQTGALPGNRFHAKESIAAARPIRDMARAKRDALVGVGPSDVAAAANKRVPANTDETGVTLAAGF